MDTNENLNFYNLISNSMSIINNEFNKLFNLIYNKNHVFFKESDLDELNSDDDFIYDLPKITMYDGNDNLLEYVIMEIKCGGNLHCLGIYDCWGEKKIIKLIDIDLINLLSIADYFRMLNLVN